MEHRLIHTDSGGLWFTKGTVIEIGHPVNPDADGPPSLDDYTAFGSSDNDTPPAMTIRGKTWHGVMMDIPHCPEDLEVLRICSKTTNRALTK